MARDPLFVNINGTLIKREELENLVGLWHEYKPATADKPEQSYVVVVHKDGATLKILPTDKCHSEQVIEKLKRLIRKED